MLIDVHDVVHDGSRLSHPNHTLATSKTPSAQRSQGHRKTLMTMSQFIQRLEPAIFTGTNSTRIWVMDLGASFFVLGNCYLESVMIFSSEGPLVGTLLPGSPRLAAWDPELR